MLLTDFRGSCPQVGHRSTPSVLRGLPQQLRPARRSAPLRSGTAQQQPLLHQRLGSHPEWVWRNHVISVFCAACACYECQWEASPPLCLSLLSWRSAVGPAEAGLAARCRPQDLLQQRMVGQHREGLHGLRRRRQWVGLPGKPVGPWTRRCLSLFLECQFLPPAERGYLQTILSLCSHDSRKESLDTSRNTESEFSLALSWQSGAQRLPQAWGLSPSCQGRHFGGHEG